MHCWAEMLALKLNVSGWQHWHAIMCLNIPALHLSDM
jgi:hypothetical protein